MVGIESSEEGAWAKMSAGGAFESVTIFCFAVARNELSVLRSEEGGSELAEPVDAAGLALRLGAFVHHWRTVLAALVRKRHDVGVTFRQGSPAEQESTLTAALSARVDEVAVFVHLASEPISFCLFPIDAMGGTSFLTQCLHDDGYAPIATTPLADLEILPAVQWLTGFWVTGGLWIRSNARFTFDTDRAAGAFFQIEALSVFADRDRARSDVAFFFFGDEVRAADLFSVCIAADLTALSSFAMSRE